MGSFLNSIISCHIVLCDLQNENFRKIYVGGLNYNTDEDGLRTFYQEWGDVTETIVMRDQTTKR